MINKIDEIVSTYSEISTLNVLVSSLPTSSEYSSSFIDSQKIFISQTFFFQTDILIRSIRRGYLFAEVPYCLGLRGSGSSKALSYPSFLGVIRGYLVLVRDFYFYKNCKFNASFGSNTSTAQRYQSSQEN